MTNFTYFLLGLDVGALIIYCEVLIIMKMKKPNKLKDERDFIIKGV